MPVDADYDQPEAPKAAGHGERFWWYVCCGPKAPYCTLFIDHPATDLRVWLWQTWQRNIAGVLVWGTLDLLDVARRPAQNPYEDPMGYVERLAARGARSSIGATATAGSSIRRVGPPTPGRSGSGPVIEPPVSSIRWEMLREGIEDYEYLWLLRDLMASEAGFAHAGQVRAYESLLVVPEAITRDMTTFTTDPGRRSMPAGPQWLRRSNSC